MMTATSAVRDELTEVAADAAIDQACRILRLPTIRDRHGEIAAAATRQHVSYKGFLTELLSVECDDREERRKARLVRDAGFPRPKRLEDFDYAAKSRAAGVHFRAVSIRALKNAKNSSIRCGVGGGRVAGESLDT
jgi:DNA replication protein DnaC